MAEIERRCDKCGERLEVVWQRNIPYWFCIPCCRVQGLVMKLPKEA